MFPPPIHFLEFWFLPRLQRLQNNQCQSLSCPIVEGTDWQKIPTGTGGTDSRGCSPLLKLTSADSDLEKIQYFNLYIVPWTSTFPTQVEELILTVVFNIHPSGHLEVPKIKPTQSQPTASFPVAGIIQGPFFHLVPETRPSRLLGYELDLSTSRS